jgi:MoaA/NifB/PqqE/SkfB family radical SAM enzyme
MPQYLQVVELLNYDEDVYTPAYHYSHETPKCSMPFKHMEVLWNGDIPLCGPNWRGAEHKRLHLGNVHENTLREIWNGQIYRQYRRAHRQRIHANMPVCQGCSGI